MINNYAVSTALGECTRRLRPLDQHLQSLLDRAPQMKAVLDSANTAAIDQVCDTARLCAQQLDLIRLQSEHLRAQLEITCAFEHTPLIYGPPSAFDHED